eukprot:g5498.t1
MNGFRRKVVAVAVSGGVDSSVAALLMKRRGFRVVGVHMTNWSQADESGETKCERTLDEEYARETCEFLDIPYHHVNFEQEYWNDVFTPLVEGYKLGVTPNPDVWCNREVKFKPLLEYARNELGADMLATGHYARLYVEGGSSKRPRLLSAVDPTKDQTYFLCGVNGESFRDVVFPVGELDKRRDVRRIAEDAKLPTWKRKDSQGICFIGKRKMSDFMGQYAEERPGPILSIVDETQIGEHIGLFSLTVGQGAKIGGSPHKWFVAKKDIETNTIWCAPKDHSSLYTNEIRVRDMNWIAGHAPVQLKTHGRFDCMLRIRHQQDLIPCTISVEDRTVRIQSHKSIRGVASQQIAALYEKASGNSFYCLGGGSIDDSYI